MDIGSNSEELGYNFLLDFIQRVQS